MTTFPASLLLFVALAASQGKMPSQPDVSREVNRELLGGNWNVLLKYHWLHLLIDRAESDEDRRSAQGSLEVFQRQSSEAMVNVKVVSVSQPRVTCSFVSGDYSVYLEEFSIDVTRQGVPLTLPFELVYASQDGYWFVFPNDDGLAANLSMAELSQWQPKGARHGVKPPDCLGHLKL